MLSSLRGCGQLRGAQPSQLTGIRGSVGGVSGRGQQLGLECVLQGGYLFVHLLQFGLVRVGEVGPGMHELLVIVLDQAQRFGVQFERAALLIDGFDPMVELTVKINGVVVRGQLGSLGLLYLLQTGVGICAGDRIEHGRHAIEQAAAFLQRDQGVLKGWRIGVIYDRPHFLELLRHTGLDRRLVIAVLDLVEGRRLKRQSARRIERIAGPEARTGGRCGARRERDRSGGRGDSEMNCWLHVLLVHGILFDPCLDPSIVERRTQPPLDWCIRRCSRTLPVTGPKTLLRLW